MFTEEQNTTLDEIIKSYYEFFRQQQDHYKVLITLNTATILIVITLFEKLLSIQWTRFFVVGALILFMASLLNSLLMIAIIGVFYRTLIDLQEFRLKLILVGPDVAAPDLKTYIDRNAKLKNKAKLHFKGANYAYFGGIVLLLAYAIINIFAFSPCMPPP